MTNKGLAGGLIVSIVINLLLAGFVAGRVSLAPPLPPPDPVFGFRHVLRMLPEERRDELGRELRGQMRELGPNLSGMRTAQIRLRQALAAEPYDPAAMERALAAFREHLLASQLASHRAFADVVARLTPEERRLLNQALERPPHGPPDERMRSRAPAPQ